MLEPAEGTQGNFIQCQEFMIANHETVLKAASEYGAVMFSNFAIKSGEEWASILYKTSLKQMNYIGGAAVRKLIVGNDKRMNDMQVLTTNESPPSEPIPFHHELAQTPFPPSHICFYSKINDADGGSTPLIRSDFVYDWLLKNYPDFCAKIEELGVKYRKVAPAVDDPSSALGRSWRSSFQCQTKEEAEVKAKEQGSTLEWMENDDCRIVSQVLPAVRVSSNGCKTFYNQIIAAYTGWIDKRNDPKKAVVFGDDSLLPDEVLSNLAKYMKENQSAYRWTPGKFVIVDNSVAYHSREPFFGRRIVYAAIAEGTKPVPHKQTDLVLNTGDRMPQAGLGLWKIARKDCADAVYNAVKAGYRLLDGAQCYENEAEVGEGLQRVFKDGVAKREDLFLVSKLWNTFHRPEHVLPACERTLKDMQVDYLDLFIVHFPISLKYVDPSVRYPPGWVDPNGDGACEYETDVKFEDTWRAMEQLVEKGLVRTIGISNMGVDRINDILKYCKIKPAVLQVEMHPFLTQDKLLRYSQENGIQVMAYSNFGSLSYVELKMATEADTCLLSEAVITPGKKYNKTPAQVVLRWAIQRGTVVIPKTTKPERMAENLALFDFSLTKAEMDAISELNINKRYNDPEHYGFKNVQPIFD